LIGVHAYWSNPVLTGTAGHHTKESMETYSMFNFELLHFILSALMYKKHIGEIHLYTDDTFKSYLEKLGYDIYWDKIDTSKTKQFNKLNINSVNNWTAFKTWLIGELECPFVLLDHDNLIYTPIPNELWDADVRFAHLEEINPYYYPDKDELKVEGFKYDDDWNWDDEVCNTSILYFNNPAFKKKYADKAMQFELLNNIQDPHLSQVQYLFADQRLLMMMMKTENIEWGTFSNLKFLPLEKEIKDSWTVIDDNPLVQSIGFDHTWSFKHQLKEETVNFNRHSSNNLILYLERHKKMLEDNFPQYLDNLKPLYNVN